MKKDQENDKTELKTFSRLNKNRLVLKDFYFGIFFNFYFIYFFLKTTRVELKKASAYT